MLLNVEAITDVDLIKEEIIVASETIDELYPTSRKYARELMHYKARLEERLCELEKRN